MKKKIIYGLLFAVAMVTASSSFVSCKDYEGDDYAGLKEQNLKLADALQKQIDGMSEYAKLTDLKDWALKSDLKDWLLKSDYNAIEDTTELHKWVDAIQASVNALKNDSVKKYADLIQQNNKLITSIGDTLHQFVFAWGDDLATALANAGKAKQIALSYDNDTLRWAEAERLSKEADLIADSAWNYVKGAKANKVLDGNNVKKSGEEFENLQELVDYFEEADQILQGEIDELNKRVDSVMNAMKKQVTGIIVQGTYSPVFGSGSLPLGIQTNILAAYASKAAVSAEVIFPSNVSADYVNNKATLTAKDLEFAQQFVSYTDVAVQPNQLLISEAADNAGKMYLTVNPTNIDFKDTKFTLVNSQGDECKVKLSALKPSQEVLKFGWTRTTIDAASENGFYEVNAQITKDDALKMQPEIDKEGFKDAVKKAVDGQKRMAVKEIARALFNSLQPVQRFGIQAKWYDDVKKSDVLYTSAYDVAAFTLEPLGFGFKVPNGKSTRIPTIDKKLIADELHINLTVEPLVVTAQDKATGKYIMLVEIPLLALDADLLAQYSWGGTYQGYPIYFDIDDTTTYVFDGVEFREGYAYIDFTKLFEQMYGDFNAALESNFNNAAITINDRLDDIAATINSYVDNANSWINRVNNLIDRLGDAVQPVLLWSDGKNAGELGGFVSANYAVGTAVKAGKEIALVPTSYSLELFAPAYKKSLIVTNAYKVVKGSSMSAQSGAGEAAGLVDAVKEFGAQFKDYALFEGNAFAPIAVKADSKFAGITFEIAYTAMDYEGKIAGRKFYLTVVE